MVETGLQQLRKIVMLRCADETRDRYAGQRATASMKVVQQHSEGFRIELDDRKLSLCQLRTIDLLRIGTDGQPRDGQLACIGFVLGAALFAIFI